MLDDFKPRKPAGAARISRTKPVEPEADERSVDEEIGNAFADAAAEPTTAADETIEIDNTPDETIDESELLQSRKLTDDVTHAKPKAKGRRWSPKSWGKKQWLVVGGIILLLGLTTVSWFMLHKKPVQQQQPVSQKAVITAAKPKTVPSRLSGMPVTAEQSTLPVTGIMIENSGDARPQSGLDQAGVVYEAVAEGGITRFLALFEENQADYIGPVRSSRPYYLRWLLPFDAAYAHVGGSPDALADIKKLGVKDLDQFSNSGPYERISSRYAPHNVYTSISGLVALEKTKKYDNSNFTGFTRKAAEPSKTPNVTSIDFTISGPLYSVHYDYDAASNSYKRSEGGEPHMVINKVGQKTQLQPVVVIALVIPESQTQSEGSSTYYTQYDTIGTGQMYVFQDGIVTTGNWSKTDDKSQFSFTDSVGKPLALNPGQTWISVVGLSGDVVYK